MLSENCIIFFIVVNNQIILILFSSVFINLKNLKRAMAFYFKQQPMFYNEQIDEGCLPLATCVNLLVIEYEN